MKKKWSYSLVFILMVLLLSIWIFFGPSTSVPEKKYFYIHSGADFETVKKELISQGVLSHVFFFDFASRITGYINHIRPGRYAINDGESLVTLIRRLKSGRQSEIRLVINKVRTKEEFSELFGRHQFEAESKDAMNFLNNNTLLKRYGYDTTDVMTAIIPNSYLIYWDGDFEKVFKRLVKEHDLFWKDKRTEKASILGFSNKEIYIIASIVEEETTKETDKPLIASVYINRLKKGMKLEADPTVKFALRRFDLTRILHDHLSVSSPYNTYHVKGLPPGPICTPSISTIDAVLNAPSTDYLFFVAKPDFSGYSNFTGDYKEHLKNAHAYQDALDKWQQKQKQNQ